MVVKPQIDKFDQYIPYPQNLKLLLRATDGTTSGMKDFSGYGRVVTNSTGATGSTTEIKINPYSMFFDGTDDVISVPDSADWDFGTGDFGISFYSKFTATNIDYFISEIGRYSESKGILIYWDQAAGAFKLSVNGAGYLSYTWASKNTNWNHIYIVRLSGVIYIYVNGISLGSNSNTSNITGSTYGISLGNNTAVSGLFYGGYINEYLVWKGSVPSINQLYPQNKPFSFRRA